MNMRETLLIDREEIEDRLTMRDVLDTVDAVFRAHGMNEVVMPAKITLDMTGKELDAWHNAMPAYVAPLRAAGIKWVGGYARNPDHGLPYIMGVIVVQDPATGYPTAIMDGSHITNLRTGAAAAVCAKYFARADSRIVGFVGAGVQARSSLDALMHLFDLKEVRVHDVRPDESKRYAEEATGLYGITARPTGSILDAVEGADIIITATYANEPLVMEPWLSPGSTSLSLGSFQEFDDAAVLSMDKIVVDSWEQCAHRGELKRFAEAGEIDSTRIFGEVGETAVGRKPGRESPDERILVVPIGLGSHDIAIAKALQDAVSAGEHRRTFTFF